MTSSERDRRRLLLTRAARDAVLAHARGSDDEVCGVLAGRRADDGDGGGGGAGDGGGDAPEPDRASVVRRVPNAAETPRTRYELDPAAALEAIEAVEAEGHGVVGFYHSHPAGPSEPSETDRAAATWTGYVYAIAVPPETVRAWRWTGDAFDPLDVRVIDD